MYRVRIKAHSNEHKVEGKSGVNELCVKVVINFPLLGDVFQLGTASPNFCVDDLRRLAHYQLLALHKTCYNFNAMLES